MAKKLSSLIDTIEEAVEGNGEGKNHVRVGLTSNTGKVLLAAMLVAAVGEMQKYVRRIRCTGYYHPNYEHLKAWFDSDSDKGPFMFAQICHILKYEPDYVRRIAYNSSAKRSYLSLGESDNLEEKL